MIKNSIMKNIIAITTTSFGKYHNSPMTVLQEKGFILSVNRTGHKLNKSETIDICKGSVGIVAGTEVYDSNVIESLAGLRVISRCGTGMDSVDLLAAKKAGIKVINTPDAPTLAVAELTVGLMLNLLRNISHVSRDVKSGIWKKRMGGLLSGKIIGIVGFGRIGKKVASLLRGFDCDIRYSDPSVDGFSGKTPLDELLKVSNIISVHASSQEKLLGDRELGLMKKGAWLINASRGDLVNEAALYKALKNGKLAGAAIDVFEKEPYDGPLKELDNVILTPHIGSYAKEARIKMEKEAVVNLLSALGKEHEIY